MYKVLKSYSKEAKQNHEIIRPRAGQQQSSVTEAHNGQIVPAYDGKKGAWPEPFEERSTYQTHEQYRKKLKRPGTGDRGRSKSPKLKADGGEAERLRRYRQAVDDYARRAREWLEWVKRETLRREQHQRESYDAAELRELLMEIDRFKRDILPPKHKEKEYLADLYAEIQSVFAGTGQVTMETELSTANLDLAWKALLKALELQEKQLRRRLDEQSSMEDMTGGLERGIRATNEKLDVLGNRIDNTRSGIQSMSTSELKDILDRTVKDLQALEPPIDGFFKDVGHLKAVKHNKADHYHGRVCDLHNRRTGYLRDIDNLIVERSEWLMRMKQDQYQAARMDIFRHCEQCIEWTEQRIHDLREMEFPEDYPSLRQTLEQHKLNNQVIVDFHTEVDKCIAKQSEVSAEDAPIYSNLLSTLESNYQQLRDLSTGRMLDLDSLAAFVEAAQRELDWITDHEEQEVKRDWSDVSQLDFAHLQKHFKLLILEINNHESKFNAVHAQGAALLSHAHPAGRVIETYLTRMQTQWDWLLSLTKCFQVHLEDAMKVNRFLEKAKECEHWVEQQKSQMETRYSKSDFSLEEGERFLEELEEISGLLDQYQQVLMQLVDESSAICPLWQRGEQMDRVLAVTAICEYPDKDIMLQKADDCLLLDNSELMRWLIQGADGTQGYVPSANLRIPPPDDRMLGFLQRLRGQFDKLRKLWGEKHRLIRFNMIMNTMRATRAWDLEKFLSIDPAEREGIMKALTDDTHRLISEMDPSDPLAFHLKDELDLTNEHIYWLMQLAQKGPDDDLSAEFDKKICLILPDLEKAWKRLNENVAARIPENHKQLENLLVDQKDFEDNLQSLDSEIAALKEIFHMLKDPNPMQRARIDELLARWEDLWELSRLYVERLQSMDKLLNSLLDVSKIVKGHEDFLAGSIDMPADLEALRAFHSQLLEMNMVLKQQQPIVEEMSLNAGQLRQHVARTRYNVADHPDVDEIDDEVQHLVDRWENIGTQVQERLRILETAIQDLIAYHSTYENEIPWLEEVERLIDTLRAPEEIQPEEYESQLDMLLVQYNQLAEHTNAFENMNHDGGRFVREAKTYDMKLDQYKELLTETVSSAFHAKLEDLSNIANMTRRVQDLRESQEKMDKIEGPNKLSLRQTIVQKLYEVNQTMATLEHLDKRLKSMLAVQRPFTGRGGPADETIDLLRRKLEELDSLKKHFQDLQELYRNEQNSMGTRLKTLQNARLSTQTGSEDRINIDNHLKTVNEILDFLHKTSRNLEDLERDRQFEEFETRRMMEDYRRGKPSYVIKSGAVQVSDELDDANRRFSQLSSVILEKRNEIMTLNQNWRRRLQEVEWLRRARQEEAARLKAEVLKSYVLIIEEALPLPKRPDLQGAPDLILQNAEDMDAYIRAVKITDNLRVQIDDENRRLHVLDCEITNLNLLKKSQGATEPEPVPIYEEPIKHLKRVDIEAAPMEPLPLLQSVQQVETVLVSELVGFYETGVVEDIATISEHEEEVQMFQEETVTKTKFYDLEAVKVIETGEILTFVEAIRQGLLDLHSGEGEFYDIVSGSRVSLEKAVEFGYITQSVSDCLNTFYGIRDPETGQEITLLQAIQLGIYDPDSRQLRDPVTGETLALYDSMRMGIISLSIVPRLVKTGILKLPPMQLKQALDQGVINIETGVFIGRYTRESMPLKDALRNGYISLANEYPPLIAICLSDCINMRFINPHSGEFKDRNSQVLFQLKDVISGDNPLINLNVREVVNTRDLTRITFGEAISQRIFNVKDCTFTDVQHHSSLNLHEARDSDFIQKPMTLKEVHRHDLVDSIGRFIDAGLKKRMTLLEAIADGLLDPDVKHIVDPEEKDVISITEALERGILNANGIISHPEEGSTFSIHEAVQHGFLVERVHHSIFDVKGIKDTKSGRNLTFTEAVEEGIIIFASETFVDTSSGRALKPDKALESGIIDPTLHQMLGISLGSQDKLGKDLTVFQGVCRGVIEPHKKIFLDQRRNQEFTPRSAYEAGFLSLRGAMWLSALFDVHPTLVPTVKPAKLGTRRISKPGAAPKDDSFEQIKITLAEAMRQGLVDARTQRFRQGDEEMTLQEALNQGLVNAEKEWIVPDRAMGVGPTVQESITEKVTETTQALAPKVYPDKNLEESVTTIKKVKTTETVAVGGPGGVSAYRAVTGAKGSLEVPTDGFHLYEAQRNGLIDLSTGMVTPPNTKRTLTLEEAFELGIINSKQIHIKDKKSGKEISPHEAISAGLMAKTGHIVDTSGRSHTLESAIEMGLVTVENEPPVPVQTSKKVIQFGAGPSSGPVMSFTPVGDATYEEGENIWSFDATTGAVIDEYSGQKLSLDDAIRIEKVSTSDIRVRDSLTHHEMGYEEAMKWGIIDKAKKYYVDKRDGRRYSLQEAAVQGFVFLTGEVPEHAHDAVQTKMKQQTKKKVATKTAQIAGPAVFVDYNLKKILDLGWYSPDTGLFTHPDTGKQMTMKESIIKGLFNPYDSYIIDTASGKRISLLDAIESELVDATTGMVVDKKSGRKINLQKASDLKIICSAVIPQTLDAVIRSGQLNLKSGLLKTADGTQTFQLHDAISQGIIDGTSIVIRNPVTSSEMRLPEAVQQNIANLHYGFIINKQSNEKINFVEAINSGIMHPVSSLTVPKLAIEETKIKVGKTLPSPTETPLARVRYAGRKTPPPVPELPLEQSRQPEICISPESPRRRSYPSAYDSSSPMSRLDEIFSGSYTQKEWSAERSPVVPYEEKKHAIVPAYSSPLQPLQVFPGTKRHEMVDVGGKQVPVKVVRGEDGIDRGEYIDPSSGMKFTIQLSGDPYTTQTKTMVKSTAQVQSVELEPHAELVGVNKVKDLRNGRVMSLNEAQRLSLAKVDKKGKQMTKTYAVFRSDIGRALNHGIIHPSSGDHLSFEDAIHCKLIDLHQLAFIHPIRGEILDFTRAANMGLMDVTLAETLPKGVCNPVNGERLTIEKAVSMKIINPQTGQVFNPFTNQRLTWLDIVKPIYTSLSTEGIYDPKKGYGVPLSSALNEGLIDTTNGLYCNPVTDEYIPLQDAAKNGLIDNNTLQIITNRNIKDWNSGKMINLLEAVDLGIVDTRKRTVILAKGLVLPIAKAVQEGKFPKDVGERLRRVDKWTFAEALGQGLIDVAANQFSDPDSGRKMTIDQAFEQGFLDTGAVHEGILDESNLSQVIESHDFDCDSGRLKDRKTGLTYTFKDAIEERLIDGDSLLYDLETCKTMTIREAVLCGIIDSNGRYNEPRSGSKVNLKDSVQFGLIALIPSPAQANQAVAEAIKCRDAEGFKFKLKKVEDPHLSPQASPQMERHKVGTGASRSPTSRSPTRLLVGKVLDKFTPIKTERPTPMYAESHIIETTPRRAFGKPVAQAEAIEPLKTSTPVGKATLSGVIQQGGFEYMEPSPQPMPRRRIYESTVTKIHSGPEITLPDDDHHRLDDISEFRGRSQPRIEELPPDELTVHADYRDVNVSYPRHHSPGAPDLNIRITSDDTAKRMRTLIDDPSALASKQEEIIRKLESGGFPVDEQLIENPVSGRLMSTKMAIESGLLDVITAEVAHPMSGRRYSLPRSVRMKMIPIEVAEAVMAVLNLPTDELASSDAVSGLSTMYSSSFTTSYDKSPGGVETTTREFSWRGAPSQLREHKGDFGGL